MNMKKEIRESIRIFFSDCIKDTLKRIKSHCGDYRPFHSRLLNDDIIKMSKFERSFSTSFGQRAIEQISKIVALDVNGTSDCETQYISKISLSKMIVNKIEAHISHLRHNTLGRLPEWHKDIRDIHFEKKMIDSNYRIISDLWFKRDDINYYFSIKTVKPNIDQTAEAKRDMMKLMASLPKAKTYLALPYNPYGEEKTSYAHNPPFKIFNMINDSCVLIGHDYWDLIGGKGTYKEILNIAFEVGNETRSLLDDFLSHPN